MTNEDARSAGWVPAAIEGATDTAALAVGLYLGGPLGAVMTAPVPALLRTGIDEFRQRWGDTANDSAARVAMVAGVRAERDPEELLGSLRGASALLAAQALSAGANTALASKIVALGNALGDALVAGDQAVLDERALVIAALADMELPHLRLLAWFAEDRFPPPNPHPQHPWVQEKLRWAARTRSDAEQAFPEYGVALDGVMSALERHGLIASVPPDYSKAIEDNERRRNSGFGMGSSAITTAPEWRATRLGVVTSRFVAPAPEQNTVETPHAATEGGGS